MHADTPEEIKKEVKKYLMVFAGLLVLTVVTVAISYLHLSVVAAVILALIVAFTKGSLVACYFMHLISEKKVIYLFLILTVIFIAGFILFPISYYNLPEGSHHLGSSVTPETEETHDSGGHHGN